MFVDGSTSTQELSHPWDTIFSLPEPPQLPQLRGQHTSEASYPGMPLLHVCAVQSFTNPSRSKIFCMEGESIKAGHHWMTFIVLRSSVDRAGRACHASFTHPKAVCNTHTAEPGNPNGDHSHRSSCRMLFKFVPYTVQSAH